MVRDGAVPGQGHGRGPSSRLTSIGASKRRRSITDVGNIGTGEILLVLLVALLVLGPTRLPGAARQVGKAMTEFRRVTTGLQTEMRDAISEFEREVAFEEPPSFPPATDAPTAPPAQSTWVLPEATPAEEATRLIEPTRPESES